MNSHIYTESQNKIVYYRVCYFITAIQTFSLVKVLYMDDFRKIAKFEFGQMRQNCS